tara:strand:+ start:1618 stop:2373 length:756 start_codon:yes stop_codon:yes gene_type:complete
MKYKKILLTGASGQLGKAILKTEIFPLVLTPSKEILDITYSKSIENFFIENDIDAVIHCAAMARMGKCKENPIKAIETNILGTSNLIMNVIKNEKKLQKKIRFIFISTDGVYPGIKGNYSEEDSTLPYNTYGWTKLGAECVVNTLYDFCIIRTNFFDTKNIVFNESAEDIYTSKIPLEDLTTAILTILNSKFRGTINIGCERKSDYDKYKPHKPQLQKCKFEDVLNMAGFPIAKDSSMDCSKWRKINKNHP